MNNEVIEARKRLAREVFGRELSTDLVAALGPRIDAAARNARILESWEASLHATEPAAVHATPAILAGETASASSETQDD